MKKLLKYYSDNKTISSFLQNIKYLSDIKYLLEITLVNSPDLILILWILFWLWSLVIKLQTALILSVYMFALVVLVQFLPLAPPVPADKDRPCLVDVILSMKVNKQLLPLPNGDTYLSPSLVVVQVHCHQPAPTLARCVLNGHIQELSAEGHSVVDVVGAAAPVPALAGWAAVLQVRVAGALGHVSCAARSCHRMHEARWCHCVYERGLLRAYKSTAQICYFITPSDHLPSRAVGSDFTSQTIIKGEQLKV